MWGEYPVIAYFSFISWDVETPDYGLYNIQLFFPDDADKEQIKARLTQLYSDPRKSFPTYYWSAGQVAEMPHNCGETELAWVSSETYASVLTDSAISRLHDDVCLREENPFSEQDLESFLNNYATVAIWTEDSFVNLDSPPSGMTRTYLRYDASGLVMLLQRYSDPS